MDKLQCLKQSVEAFNDQYVSRCTEKARLVAEYEDFQLALQQIDIASLEKASFYLQKMSEGQRQIAKSSMEELGTQALQYAFGSNYKLELELTELRKKPNIVLYITKTDTGIRTTPRESNGGGVIDVSGLSLRVVLLQVHEPFIDGPILFDEPCKYVSEDYIPMVANFIKNLVGDFGRQIILSTHNKFLASIADQEVHMSLDKDNVSIVSHSKS